MFGTASSREENSIPFDPKASTDSAQESSKEAGQRPSLSSSLIWVLESVCLQALLRTVSAGMEGRELRNRFLFESSLALKDEAPSISRTRVRKGRAVRVCKGCGNIERSIRKSCPKEETLKSPAEVTSKPGKKKQALDKPTKLSSSFLFE
ncbi:hypothetical protein NDN08_004424 [Rhodosorus marinus]|uniref:Uncharacterized protein n=1 Tax=Rhodosorus marinus TaxID=101924 RepID=A0AAV8UPB6_9RHOD|nr:hypothetical protein NDN08_004424 [Rhodosorus marinus]